MDNKYKVHKRKFTLGTRPTILDQTTMDNNIISKGPWKNCIRKECEDSIGESDGRWRWPGIRQGVEAVQFRYSLTLPDRMWPSERDFTSANFSLLQIDSFVISAAPSLVP